MEDATFSIAVVGVFTNNVYTFLTNNGVRPCFWKRKRRCI